MIGSHNLTFLPQPQQSEDLHRTPKSLEAIEILSGFNALPEGAVDPSLIKDLSNVSI